MPFAFAIEHMTPCRSWHTNTGVPFRFATCLHRHWPQHNSHNRSQKRTEKLRFLHTISERSVSVSVLVSRIFYFSLLNLNKSEERCVLWFSQKVVTRYSEVNLLILSAVFMVRCAQTHSTILRERAHRSHTSSFVVVVNSCFELCVAFYYIPKNGIANP